jgi:hypothetical protein
LEKNCALKMVSMIFARPHPRPRPPKILKFWMIPPPSKVDPWPGLGCCKYVLDPKIKSIINVTLRVKYFIDEK